MLTANLPTARKMMGLPFFSVLIGSVLLMQAVPASAQGSVARGKTIFARCSSCHSVEKGVTKLGPSLNGIVERQAGSVAGFRYSSAMKAYRKAWDIRTLDAFLANPRAQVPGTSMAFAGVQNAADRQALVAYLTGLK